MSNATCEITCIQQSSRKSRQNSSTSSFPRRDDIESPLKVVWGSLNRGLAIEPRMEQVLNTVCYDAVERNQFILHPHLHKNSTWSTKAQLVGLNHALGVAGLDIIVSAVQSPFEQSFQDTYADTQWLH